METVRILVVDDDPAIVLLARFLLEAEGHHVSEAESGAEAAAQLASHHADVMLMDVMLGAEDGVAVAASLLADCAGRNDPLPKLIFLTAATRPEQLERMHASGAAGILPKPFDPDTFASELQRILDE